MKRKLLSIVLCVVILFSSLVSLAGCFNTGNKVDALVIMTENLDGLFNPFFSTSATDSTIVSMTQIGMLSAAYVNGEVVVAFGENEATATKDFEYVTNEDGDTVYTFVIKNGVKFSDGHALTIEDVLFNLYVYLDPVYTGSATIYSTDIKGLAAYRQQNPDASSDDESNEMVDGLAEDRAVLRIQELALLFDTLATNSNLSGNGYNVSVADMKTAILGHTLSSDYLAALAVEAEQYKVTVQQLLKDYEYALELFKKELDTDFEVAKDAYTEAPYKGHDEFNDPIFCFLFAEGFVEVEYEKKPGTNEDDKSKIKKLTPSIDPTMYPTKEAIIERVYNDMITENLPAILLGSVSAQTLINEYTAKAKEVILHEMLGDEGLIVENISGIVSLGHTDLAGSTIKVNGTDYKIASTHNADGTPVAADEYDVLQITINGIDPKAHWNFAFTVAPQHYYGEGSKVGVNISENQFGVEWGSFDFMKNVIQSQRNIKLPMGAGAYKVTDRQNSDNPTANEFYKDNVVYFKANQYFNTVGAQLENAKTEKVRYQVVSASNAVGALEEGSVHFVTPQLTNDNFDKITALKSKGMEYLLTDQLGYGYIGVNAAKVEDINLRKAIMCAMNTTLALDYYRPGTASQIYYSMSKVSWAYPTDASGEYLTDNGKDYPQLGEQWNETIARSNIEKYMTAGGYSAGDSALKVTFTIAGSNLQDHPTYKTFRDAAALLNSMGWDVTVEADTQALTKINTGSLAVWAAAWGSTIDPDMYQIYHKDSTATSTLGWGYKAIKDRGGDELDILNRLSKLIDDARETNNQTVRAATYKQAMELVLALAVELPVYQRSTLYAYNSKVINSASLPTQSEMNPYSTPLDRIWEIELVK